MFTFILFLAIIVIFVWASNRLSSLQQRLETLEHRLKYLQVKQRPAQEEPAAAPVESPPVVKPAAAPSPPAKAEPPIIPTPPEPPIPAYSSDEISRSGAKSLDELKLFSLKSAASQSLSTEEEHKPAPAVTPLPQESGLAGPPVIPPPPPKPPVPPGPSRQMPKFDWENLVGVKLFSWIAGIALLLAAVFFLRYSISQGWLMPSVRMAIGIIVGIGLLMLCELKAARKYPVTANAMDASAIAILFSTFFAARALWNLIDVVPAFALMVLVTAVAVLLSIRRDSVFIALLGLVGGFATPALLSTGVNRPLPLFSYILLLNAGLAWVAVRKKWPLLTMISFVLTVIYQWAWVMKFLTASQLPVALLIFLIFPALAFAAFALGQRSGKVEDWATFYGQAGNLSVLLPFLFALYMAAVPGYGHSFGLLFGFLFLLDAGLFAIAVARGPELLHLVGGLSTLLIWAIWLTASYDHRAWPSVIGFILLFAFFYLAAPFIARRISRGFKGIGKYAVFAAPLILFALVCITAMEPACESPGILFGALFLIMLGASAYAVHEEEGVVYYIAALFALLAQAVWSIKYLGPERLYSGLGLYAVFSLLFIGVPALAQRLHKRLRPEIAGAGLLFASLALLFFLTTGSVASVSIWGLALLLFVLNAGLIWQGTVCKFPILAVAGMILSWIVLGTLWASVSLAVILLPALVVVAAFALFVLAGNIWMQKQADEQDAALLGNSTFLGLTGHVFLAIIAGQKTLCVPPGPLLGILLVLDLAVGAAALYMRRDGLHRAAMVASGVILILWVTVAEVTPYPEVAVFSAGMLALFSLAWIYLVRRMGIEATPFSKTAAITIVLGQFVTIFAEAQVGSLQLGFLVTAHLLFVIVLLALEWYRKTYAFAVIAVLPTAIAVLSWFIRHSAHGFWPQLLLFSIPIYLVFIAYPLLLGRRVGQSIAPCLAAVLASIPFFFEARQAMINAGWGPAIGILPVIQALLLSLVLMRLLNIEPPGARQLGRLALIAGAALAFVTVAIPLQLEKEWITIGWALEAAALAWLYCKIPHRGLLYFTSGLFAAVFIRLALNPSVLVYQVRGGTRIWNWYLYTYAVAAAAMILGGRLLSKTKDAFLSGLLRLSRILPAGAVVLLFLLLNIEIADFYSIGRTITFNFSATLAQDLTYTLGWAAFAVSLLAVGIFIRNQPARIASLALLVVTIFKCFFPDLARLGGLYRVASFVGLALCLALVALALQKFVLSARREEQ
jgi:hypothetical protein